MLLYATINIIAVAILLLPLKSARIGLIEPQAQGRLIHPTSYKPMNQSSINLVRMTFVLSVTLSQANLQPSVTLKYISPHLQPSADRLVSNGELVDFVLLQPDRLRDHAVALPGLF